MPENSLKNQEVKSKKSGRGCGFVNLISFATIICIGVSLLVGRLGVGSISGAFRTIADVLAYIVTIVSSLLFVIRCRRLAFYIIWVVCVAATVVLLIL